MELICPQCCSELRRVPGPREASSGDNSAGRRAALAPAAQSQGCEAPREDAWRCDHCAKQFPIRQGVVCFLKENDPFYEGRFPGTYAICPPGTRVGRLFLWLRLRWALDLQYAAMLRRRLTPHHRRILDLGCGGGNTELLRHGAEVVGVDLSFGSLRNAAAVYAAALQASAARLPFPDASFEAIVSSNFLGHIPFEEKEAVYNEMRRLLAPGGVMLHEIETDSAGALFRYARGDPGFFQKQMIDLDGHVGAEMPRASLERFRRHGFEIEWARADFVWYFLPQGELLKRFDNAYSRRNPILRALLALDRLLADRPRARKMADLLFGVANGLARSVTPLDKGIGLCIVARRPRNP